MEAMEGAGRCRDISWIAWINEHERSIGDKMVTQRTSWMISIILRRSSCELFLSPLKITRSQTYITKLIEFNFAAGS